MPPDDLQWWRDATLITYEPRGSVTRRMAEARLLRALTLDRALKSDMRPYRSNAAVIADLKGAPQDYRGPPTSDYVPRLVPLPQDHKDYLTVMTWWCEARPDWNEVAILDQRKLGPPVGWTSIGFSLRPPVDGRKVKRLYDSIISRVHDAANRLPTTAAKPAGAPSKTKVRAR